MGLDLFRDPASVAVVGASDNPAKWGYWLARGALAGLHRREVFLVNHKGSSVLGQPAWRDLGGLPFVPELVVVCVPAASAADVIDQGLKLGVPAFLAITTGLADEIAERVRAAGARLLGPNSLGLYDAAGELQLAWGDFTPGSLAVVSQSGQLGLEIARLGERLGIGLSRFVSIGNQVDIHALELLEDLVEDSATRVVAVYLESFAGGIELVRVLSRLTKAGKQVLLLTAGGSEGSQRSARSHTGSLTSALDVVDAACRAAGALRVVTPSELVDTAALLLAGLPVRGRRLAVVSDSGGQGCIAADVAVSNGLLVPAFSAELRERLAGVLPVGASMANPVDLAGAGEADLFTYPEVVRLVQESGEVDAVVLSGYLGCYGEDSPSLAQLELETVDRLADEVSVPVVIHTMSGGSAALDRMRARPVPAYPNVESAVTSVAQAVELAERPGREVRAMPTDSLPLGAGYGSARSLLAELGIAVPRSAPVELAAELTYPVVLKAGWIEHKSEAGGVRLGIESAADLKASFDQMYGRFGAGEYVVEEQDVRADVVEMLVGGRVDRDFGPLIAVGAGGVETELRADVCVELAPVDEETALAMIRRLDCLPLLEGWRGRPAVDLAALARIVVAVSEAIASRSALRELELNPVRVSPAGALAVDVLVVTDA